MIEVEFTQDFADKKKGDHFKCDSHLANQLIRGDKVAIEVKEHKPTPATKELKTKIKNK